MEKLDEKIINYTETINYRKGFVDGYKKGHYEALEICIKMAQNIQNPSPIILQNVEEVAPKKNGYMEEER